MSLCLNYESFVSLSILFGLSSSAMVSLQSIILIYLFGLENLTDSFAFLKLFIGSSIIAGPPFAGYIHWEEKVLDHFLNKPYENGVSLGEKENILKILPDPWAESTC